MISTEKDDGSIIITMTVEEQQEIESSLKLMWGLFLQAHAHNYLLQDRFKHHLSNHDNHNVRSECERLTYSYTEWEELTENFYQHREKVYSLFS